MPAQTSSEFQPVSVNVDNAPLDMGAYDRLLNVSVAEHLEGPSQFTLRFSAWKENGNELDFSLADGDLFKIGGAVEISFADDKGESQPLMLGNITGLDVDFGAGEVPSLSVTGLDRRHLMQRGIKEKKTFDDMTDSDIAAQIVKDGAYGLTSEVVDTKEKLPHVTQDKSDLEFLHDRAKLIGYEVLVQGKTLHFRPSHHLAEPKVTLDAASDLLSLSVHQQASTLMTQVVVRGWDPMAKKVILGKATSSDQEAMGATGGADVVKQAFGESVLTIAALDVSTEEAANKLARSLLDRMALKFVTGNGECFGRANLHAGDVMDVKGVGDRFSGTYYITSATHTYSPQRGYRTSFSVQRNAG